MSKQQVLRPSIFIFFLLLLMILSLGPAFVCFLGEKYGYRPFPARIPAKYMNKMWPFVRQAELEYTEEFMKNQKIKWNLIRIATKDSATRKYPKKFKILK